MLVDKELTINWNNATKNWYIEKGYVFTKIRDSFVVKVEDITPTSTLRVRVKCDFCGKEHTKEYRKLISGREVIEKDCCSSKKCLAQKTKEINLKLYGVENTMQREEVKSKTAKTQRKPYEEVVKLCEEKGLELITGEQDYKNNRTKISVICKNHIEKGVQFTTVNNINKSKHCCYYGANELVGNMKRLNFNIVRDKFIELDYEPLFTEDDYKGNNSKLNFICDKHRDKGSQYIRYSNLQQGATGCKYCAKEKASSKLRLDQEFIFNEFYKRGLKVLEGEIYKGKDNPIRYVCLKHPDVIQHSTYNNLKKVNQPCDICRNEESLSSLNKRFRSSITMWKSETEKKDNYKCIFTDSETYEIHHLHPYNEIIKEALDNLKIDRNTTDGVEIELLKKEVVRLHEVHGLGVCIHPDIHILFHREYGKDGTREDFIEFEQKYRSGYYNNV